MTGQTPQPMRGRFLPNGPPRRRQAEDYDFWWRDGRLVVQLPLRGGNDIMSYDYAIPEEDECWLSGPPEAPTLACPIMVDAYRARGMRPAIRLEWAGMLTGGHFLRLFPERKRKRR